MNASAEEQDEPDIFTGKQRQVLDLLIEHKTSKEIARELGISPYTVDQRISLARAKLGVSSRNELAARYQEMRSALGASAAIDPASSGEQADTEDLHEHRADEAWTEPVEDLQPQIARHEATSNAISASDLKINSCPTVEQTDYRVGPEMFEGSSGGLWRLGAVLATALVLVVTILGLFAIFNQLNEMLS